MQNTHRSFTENEAWSHCPSSEKPSPKGPRWFGLICVMKHWVLTKQTNKSRKGIGGCLDWGHRAGTFVDGVSLGVDANVAHFGNGCETLWRSGTSLNCVSRRSGFMAYDLYLRFLKNAKTIKSQWWKSACVHVKQVAKHTQPVSEVTWWLRRESHERGVWDRRMTGYFCQSQHTFIFHSPKSVLEKVLGAGKDLRR